MVITLLLIQSVLNQGPAKEMERSVACEPVGPTDVETDWIGGMWKKEECRITS